MLNYLTNICKKFQNAIERYQNNNEFIDLHSRHIDDKLAQYYSSISSK